jgi:hypothetical protein
MSGRDAYYSPSFVASALARALPMDLSGRILDPAAGGGALLEAAEARFGTSIQNIAIDIDSGAIRHLQQHGHWWVSQANVLSMRSRAASHAWQKAREELAAVLINPPFSARGAGGVMVSYGAFQGRVAPSVEFIHTMITLLEPVFGFYAILPDGALDADRHQGFWSEVRNSFTVERLEHFDQRAFKGARVSTSLVRITHGVLRPSLDVGRTAPVLKAVDGCRCIEVIRGRVPVYKVGAHSSVSSVPFLHTTDLADSQPPWNRAASESLADFGPLIAIPRVGSWVTPRRVALESVVLSDCIIGLRARNTTQEAQLLAELDSSAEIIRSHYKGSGAKYITLISLVGVLEELGWRVSVLRAGAPRSFSCSCSA